MYCRNCGAHVEDDAAFCSACGAAQQQAENAYTYAEPVQNTDPEAKKSASIGVLVWGILGLFFAIELPLLGLIFSCVGKKKAAEYEERFGEAKEMAGIGKGLAVAGFIVGLVLTILGAVEALSMLFSAGFLASLFEFYPF